MTPGSAKRSLSLIAALLRYSRFDARQIEPSLISSADDLAPAPTQELIELAIESAGAARHLDLSTVEARCRDELDRKYVALWPGEHYRLLAALASVLRPDLVVEVGTATGLSALALLRGGAQRVVTFDVVPWHAFEKTVLTESDHGDRLQQVIGNLADPDTFARHRELLAAADLVFVDGPKDGAFEPAFLAGLVPLLKESGALLVLDDVRVLPMLATWRNLDLPKLDITSFGHWSGTGLARAAPRR